jgi:hypothetical protein
MNDALVIGATVAVYMPLKYQSGLYGWRPGTITAIMPRHDGEAVYHVEVDEWMPNRYAPGKRSKYGATVSARYIKPLPSGIQVQTFLF